MVKIPRFSTKIEFNIDDFLDAMDFQCLKSGAKKLISTLKTQLIQRLISVDIIKPILVKRGFDIEFYDTDSPLKLSKKTKKSLFPQKDLFIIKPKKTLEIKDIQQAITEALKPLVMEI
jgi:hypothetical protein